MRNPLVVDGRNFLDDEALRAAGFTYEGIGRPARRRSRPDACRPSSSPAARARGCGR
jgi:hypothetical protein